MLRRWMTVSFLYVFQPHLQAHGNIIAWTKFFQISAVPVEQRHQQQDTDNEDEKDKPETTVAWRGQTVHPSLKITTIPLTLSSKWNWTADVTGVSVKQESATRWTSGECLGICLDILWLKKSNKVPAFSCADNCPLHNWIPVSYYMYPSIQTPRTTNSVQGRTGYMRENTGQYWQICDSWHHERGVA